MSWLGENKKDLHSFRPDTKTKKNQILGAKNLFLIIDYVKFNVSLKIYIYIIPIIK